MIGYAPYLEGGKVLGTGAVATNRGPDIRHGRLAPPLLAVQLWRSDLTFLNLPYCI